VVAVEWAGFGRVHYSGDSSDVDFVVLFFAVVGEVGFAELEVFAFGFVCGWERHETSNGGDFAYAWTDNINLYIISITWFLMEL